MTGTLQTKKLKDGEYYYVVLYLYENGKRKPKWIPTGLPIRGNKKRAEQILRDTLREHEQRFVSPESHVLYSDWVGAWLREAKKRVDGVTRANYKSTAELYVIPYFKSRGTQLGGDHTSHAPKVRRRDARFRACKKARRIIADYTGAHPQCVESIAQGGCAEQSADVQSM